jgi:Rrf2 family nitric oxide-sensitive transcriptional repressor
MLSQTAEYALRAIVCLSDQPDKPLTGPNLARATQVPAGYLSKVMQSLARAGLVDAQRGKNGGFSLTSRPDQITILHVINAVDPLQRIRKCPLGLKGHERLCPLHRRLDEALEHVERVFAETRISDLLHDAAVKPLCELVELAHA